MFVTHSEMCIFNLMIEYKSSILIITYIILITGKGWVEIQDSLDSEKTQPNFVLNFRTHVNSDEEPPRPSTLARTWQTKMISNKIALQEASHRTNLRRVLQLDFTQS